MIKLNRARIILLSLFVSTLVLLVPAALSHSVRLAAADLFEPITSTARHLLGGVRARITSFGRGSKQEQDLKEERRRRMELETLLAEKVEEIARLRRARTESAELRRALERVKWRRGLPLAANVIRRPGKWESHELIIDRGRRSGVESGAPVLVGEAVLGVVAEASEDTARVLVLGHPEVAVPARITQNRLQGLVESSGRKIKLNYVVRDRERPVRKGYTVVTSGLGKVFPPGCLLGQIGPGVTPAEGKPFYDITVQLPQNTSNPEIVWVLTKLPAAGKPGTGSGKKKSR
jgi:rod shape-determining protein MreC